ncbi:immune inhibitor A [Lapillicoccus jejuensis]
MSNWHWRVVSGVAVTAVAFATLQAPAVSAPAAADPDAASSTARSDNLPNPLAEKQAAVRAEAVKKLATGEAKLTTRGGDRVIALKGGKDAQGKQTQDRYVSYPVDREEAIFTVLTDFGDKTMTGQSSAPGPVHNQIAAPDRRWDGGATDDNSTYWTKNFDRAHYENMMFGDTGQSFKDFYAKQSNGRFLAKGDVSDWVTVPYNEARYGSNTVPQSDGYWSYINDTAQAWFAAEKAKGKTTAEIKAYLQQFDQVDRYDSKGDGVYNRPDGYIDHFQAIHAGEGEEAGGGKQGTDAIWSHRWYAYSNGQGRTGPEGNKLGGVQIGDTGIWIGDYTTEPENGGLGVFTHEFGHDLGLPDLYDTQGGDNGTGFWTLMSAGSWLNKGVDSIGTTPGYMGPWEKMQLGWLDYQTVQHGYDRDVKIGPADRDGATTPQALMVTLPKKTVTTSYNTPHSGTSEWWGGSADNLNSTLTRDIDLTGARSASVSAWLQLDTEKDYDFLYAEASADGGATWDQVGPAMDGTAAWAERTWDLGAWAGKDIQFRFRYNTDGGVHEDGPFLDDLKVVVDGTTVLSDDVESGTNGWTAVGFTRMGGSTSKQVEHFYLAENRVYSGYDKTLQTGPYNFGWSTRPDWVERFPYQNGLLVWYVDGEFTDNNTSKHPGGGLVLPVDARPKSVVFSDGFKLGNRRQPFDATFGLEQTDAVTFHHNGVAKTLGARPGIPTFNDTDPERYWDAANPGGSVKVAGTGTKITVARTSVSGQDMWLQVRFAQQGAK